MGVDGTGLVGKITEQTQGPLEVCERHSLLGPSRAAFLAYFLSTLSVIRDVPSPSGQVLSSDPDDIVS